MFLYDAFSGLGVFNKLIWCTIGSNNFVFGIAQFSDLWAR